MAKLVEIAAKHVKEWQKGATHLVVGECGWGVGVTASFTEGGPPVFRNGAWAILHPDCGDSVFWLAKIDDSFGLEESEDNIITRAQWEAERDWILLESQPERDPFIKELVEIACKNKRLPDVNDIDVADLNQALWDKVAIASTQAFITAHVTHFGHENVWESKELVSCAADYADAFMAERVKRMKGAQ